MNQLGVFVYRSERHPHTQAVILVKYKPEKFRMFTWDRTRNLVVPGQFLYAKILPKFSSWKTDGFHTYFLKRNAGFHPCVSISEPPHFTAKVFQDGVFDLFWTPKTGANVTHLNGVTLWQASVLIDVSQSSLIVNNQELINFREFSEFLDMPGGSLH